MKIMVTSTSRRMAAFLLINQLNHCLLSVASFQTTSVKWPQRNICPSTSAMHSAKKSEYGITRGTFLSVIVGSALFPSAAFANGSRSITACKIDANNCVSTLNIKQLESYSPPWTFEVSPDEAFARIKGVLASDDSFTVKEVDDEARYVRATVKRVFQDQDEIEFLVKGDDKAVVFKSSEIDDGSLSDFGANRKRIDSIRKKGAVFDLMGGGLTADSYEGGGAATRGNGALGQLKAFYGLQSGQGFQGVFEDED
mmetsp:Transcript_29925/g.62976  ORF Transcript_29925/g.62976 Transcript_29925/m.62976 type:complete len:254 (+) Transcript_29925:144-905(+)